jgi:hypothetical protein
VCFVDFKKAFDSVVRKTLLHELLKKCIGEKFFDLITNMYSNTMYSCKFGNSHSDPFSANLEVKQGDSLTPTLFNVFADDIGSCFNNLPEIEPVNLGTHKFNHLLYADDLILISEKPSWLQHCLNALEEWGLNINTKKTQILIFSNNKKAPTNELVLNFTFKNSLLEKINEYKYLIGLDF